MVRSTIATHKGGAIGRLLLVSCLVVLLGFFLPTTVLSAPPQPDYEGPEKCAECHSAETEAWQNSPHAKAMTTINETLQLACSEDLETSECDCLTCHTTDFNPADRTYAHAGVTCEACHGPYVEDHPKNGVMHLDVDSSVCSDCHVDTYEQWKDSPHGQAGVQCIGCHLSHSQDFRLTDEALCGACHRNQLEDFAHSVHSAQDVTCTDCHLSTTASSEPVALASIHEPIGGTAAPSHRFSVVSSQACAGCHGQAIHEEALPGSVSQVATSVQLPSTTAGPAPELVSELEAAEQANKSLKVMTLVSLGLGLGIGGMLGVVFMLVVGYVSQGRSKQ
jgi:hypothetical protein